MNKSQLYGLFFVCVGLGLLAWVFAGEHSPVKTPPSTAPMVGAAVPVTTSFYDDSLQSGITSTATNLQLVSGVDSQGKSLSGLYGFVIDQGTASQEIVVCSSVSGTSATGCMRGVDLTTGTTSVASLQFTHNRGASVQITTAPVVNIMANILRGVESIGAPLFYAAHPCSVGSASTTVCDKNYIDTATISGAPPGTNSVAGIYLLGTAAQNASTTGTGTYNATTYNLVMPSGTATDTPTSKCNALGSAAGAGCTVVATLLGKISQNFLDIFATINSWTKLQTFAGITNTAATTTIGATNVNSNAFIANSVAYAFPGSQGATGSKLTNDGSGNLSWSASVPHFNYATTTGAVFSQSVSTFGSSTPFVIPSGTLSASSTLHIIASISTSQGSNVGATFYVRDALGHSIASCSVPNTLSSGGYTGYCMFDIYMNGSTASEIDNAIAEFVNGSAQTPVSSASITTASIDLSGSPSIVGVVSSGNTYQTQLNSMSMTVNP